MIDPSLQIFVGDLLVDGLALLELGDLARLVEPLIDVLAAENAVVLRRAALEEDVAVAVGIDAAAPADEDRPGSAPARPP